MKASFSIIKLISGKKKSWRNYFKKTLELPVYRNVWNKDLKMIGKLFSLVGLTTTKLSLCKKFLLIILFSFIFFSFAFSCGKKKGAGGRGVGREGKTIKTKKEEFRANKMLHQFRPDFHPSSAGLGFESHIFAAQTGDHKRSCCGLSGRTKGK